MNKVRPIWWVLLAITVCVLFYARAVTRGMRYPFFTTVYFAFALAAFVLSSFGIYYIMVRPVLAWCRDRRKSADAAGNGPEPKDAP